MQPRTKNIAKGAARELKGRFNEAAGKLTGKPSLKVKGRIQKAAGRAQRKLGEAQRDLDKEREREESLEG